MEQAVLHYHFGYVKYSYWGAGQTTTELLLHRLIVERLHPELHRDLLQCLQPARSLSQSMIYRFKLINQFIEIMPCIHARHFYYDVIICDILLQKGSLKLLGLCVGGLPPAGGEVEGCRLSLPHAGTKFFLPAAICIY